MKYYIFKVTTNQGRVYYKVNNRFIGYIDFDSNFWRAKQEELTNPPIKPISYELFASGEVTNDRELHQMFCESQRFNLRLAKKISADHKLKSSKDSRKYNIYQPNKNSSHVYLKEIDGKATIK